MQEEVNLVAAEKTEETQEKSSKNTTWFTKAS